MKELLLVAAVVGLATTGCAQNRFLGKHGFSGQASHIIRSQNAPRPEIIRTAHQQGGCSSCQAGGGGCSDGSCDGDLGCEDGGCGEGVYDADSGRGGRLFGRSGWCQNCSGRGCGLCGRIAERVAGGFGPHSGGYPESYNFTPSPPTGQTAYPYYTTRGPRDFLQANPPSIGPY